MCDGNNTSVKGIEKVRPVLQYFYCMTGNTFEAWSYFSLRLDSDMLQVYFILCQVIVA
jgi:hypothetical protein